MTSEAQNPPALVWRLFCLVVAAVGLGGSGNSVVNSRVPLVLAFIPVGKVTRVNSPIMYWLIVTSGLIVGALGLVGLSRRIGNTDEFDPEE